jgi:hypothetical protein
MRHLLAALLLLPLPALAQEPDPLRTNTQTGEPRSAFDPIIYDETAVLLRACLDGAGKVPGAAEAEACTQESRTFCEEVRAGYPLARGSNDACLLNAQLAWGEVRYAVGEEVTDALYEEVFAGKEAARAEADAFVEEDGAWRTEAANSCLGDMEPDARNLCELEVQRDRALLYLARLAEVAAR